MKRSFWFRRIFFFILLAFTAILLLSFVVMSIWNGVLTAVLNVPVITFGQALGILVLSKILFGGFRGGWGRGRSRWGREMKEKWQKMTPEEQQKFKQEWRSRCTQWRTTSSPEQPVAES